MDQMLCWTFLLLLSAASAGVSLASPAGDAPQPGPPPAEDDTPETQSADDRSAEDNVINRNAIFGRSCAEGLLFVHGQCVHTEFPRSPAPLSPLPNAAGDDDDDFLKLLGFDPDPLPSELPSATPAPDIPGEHGSIDSLSDEEFLRDLLHGVGKDACQSPPLDDRGYAIYRWGVALVSAASVLLVVALLVALWAGGLWRSRWAKTAITV